VYISQLLFPNIGKYAVEVSIALATLLMAALQFSTQNAAQAAANLSIFLAAGSRVAPALLRIQNGMITLKSNLGQVTPTLALLDGRNRIEFPKRLGSSDYNSGFIAEIEVNNLEFRYPASNNFEIRVSSLKIEQGNMVAIIGKSGSGKTSLVDLMLGLKVPLSGECKISGIVSREAVEKWPGRIAYVPQHVEIFEGSIAENIAIGETRDNIDVSRVVDLLNAVKLFTEVVHNLDGVWQNIGGKEGALSGGQRQRLGIARALYHDPSLIILDEATSALDGESEHVITNLFLSLKSKVTIVAIAHRLSTVEASDLVIYMDKGRIIASGSFEHLKATLGSDLTKARILGLHL
jgi:ABC-type multidrug transport system fused ATPase/permease subunit